MWNIMHMDSPLHLHLDRTCYLQASPASLAFQQRHMTVGHSRNGLDPK